MAPLPLACFCCQTPLPSPSTSITKFISDHPYLSMLENSCSSIKDLKKIHAQLIKTGLIKDTIAASRVLAFCASPIGDINYAYLVFTQISNPNLFTWNTIIRAFSQSSNPQFAISLFLEMLLDSNTEPQRLTYPSVFKAYAQLGLARDGAQLHGRVVKLGLDSDAFIRNTIISMYANCGFLSEAWRVFDDEDLEFDVVAWNSIIMGLAKCDEVDDARKLFDEMPLRNTITWNSMISGYVRHGNLVEALELFGEMQEEKVKPSEFTMVSLLNACACLGALSQGEWIHDYLEKNYDFESNTIVVTALVDMYCKCGRVEKALQVFKSAPKRGLSCWNSIISGLATNGCAKEAVQFFSELESSRLKPDAVSFISVLTACNHSGLVDEAKYYFSMMTEKYRIRPSIKHYSCMVDVLGKAGLLEEAEKLIRTMPVDHDAIIWATLLSACRKHENVEMAKRAAEKVMEMDPDQSSGYVLMSNVFAANSQFDEAIKQRLSLEKRQILKEPGCSLIEVNGEVHEFVSSGRRHPNAQEIYTLLNGVQNDL